MHENVCVNMCVMCMHLSRKGIPASSPNALPPLPRLLWLLIHLPNQQQAQALEKLGSLDRDLWLHEMRYCVAVGVLLVRAEDGTSCMHA